MYQKEVDKIPKEVFSGNKTKAIKLMKQPIFILSLAVIAFVCFSCTRKPFDRILPTESELYSIEIDKLPDDFAQTTQSPLWKLLCKADGYSAKYSSTPFEITQRINQLL